MGWLFDSSLFMTRGHCGDWSSSLVACYQISNLLIALAYFSIPVALTTLWSRKRHTWPRPWMLLCFASFILLCGLTHAADWLVFYWAPYRLYTVILAMTAAVSVTTALTLPGTVRYLLQYASPEEYEQVILSLRREIQERSELEDQLEKKNRMIEQELESLKISTSLAATNTEVVEKVTEQRRALERIRDA